MIAVCPECKRRVEPEDDQCPVCKASMSVPDAMIEASSTPNLASLFKQAKQAGHIKAGFQYGSSS